MTSAASAIKRKPASRCCSRTRDVEGKDTGGNARLVRGADDARHRGLHVGVLRIAEMTETRGEIGRSDEQAIDARRRRDLFHLLQAARRLDLHDGRDLRVGRLHVVAPHAVRRGAHRAGDAALAVERSGGRILRETHGTCRLVRGFDIREHQRARAGIQHALDEPRLRWTARAPSARSADARQRSRAIARRRRRYRSASAPCRCSSQS